MAPKRAAKKPPSPPPSSSAEDDASSSDEGEQEQQPPASKKKSAVSSATAAQKLKPNPPPPSSSEEEGEEEEEEEKGAGKEESSGGEEGEEEESDSDAEGVNNRSPELVSVAKKQEKQPPAEKPASESSESGSSDGSDSEKPISVRRPPRGADPSIKPVSSRPMDDPKLSKPSRAPPTASPKAKSRPSDSSLEKERGSEKKRKLFERFWSEDDEVNILQGILDYHTRKRTDPSAAFDMDAVHEYLRTALNSEFTKSQLTDKIRRLKKKYETLSARVKNGAPPNFAKPQERTAYELSCKIWARKENKVADGDAESDRESEEKENHVVAVQSPRKPRGGAAVPAPMVVDEDKDEEEGEESYPLLMDALTNMENLKMSVSAAKKALAEADSAKVTALEERFRKHRMVEMKHQVQWLDMMKDTMKLIMEGLGK